MYKFREKDGIATGELMFRTAWLFFQENGEYVFLSSLAHGFSSVLRNRMLARTLHENKLKIGPRSRLHGLACVTMGRDFAAGEGLWLEANTSHGDQSIRPRLVIGNHVRIGHWSHIARTGYVEFGDPVLIGSKVVITDHNQGLLGSHATSPRVPPAERPLGQDRSTRIGANVWPGDGVVVCPGVTLGEGSIAGANAVVTADVLASTLVAGVPARPIRRYDDAQGCWINV